MNKKLRKLNNNWNRFVIIASGLSIWLVIITVLLSNCFGELSYANQRIIALERQNETNLAILDDVKLESRVILDENDVLTDEINDLRNVLEIVNQQLGEQNDVLRELIEGVGE